MAEFRDTDPGGDTPGDDRPAHSLRNALRIVRDRQAERDDVVVDMQAAEGVRIERLADELRPLIKDIPDSDERFEFAVSHGERPRLWVDMTSHVSMGADRRTYRFVKDTRLGRIVLAESGDLEKVADQIALYVAEKIQERERLIEGEWVSIEEARKAQAASAAETVAKSGRRKGGFWRSVFTFLFGVAVTLAVFIGVAYLVVPEAFGA